MKRLISAILVVIVLFAAIVPKQQAKADGLTLSMLSGAAYAIAQSSGLTFGFGSGATGSNTDTWMQNRINSYLAGRTIAEVFGSEVIRLTAGKLVIPAKIVNELVTMLGQIKTSLNLSENASTSTQVTPTQVNGCNLYPTGTLAKNAVLNAFGQLGGLLCTYTDTGTGFAFTVTKYNGTTETKTISYKYPNYVPAGWFLKDQQNSQSYGYILVCAAWKTTDHTDFTTSSVNVGLPDEETKIPPVSAIIPGSYTPPESLNDLQEWNGEVRDGADTNIGDLLGDIFDDVAQGDLIIDNPEVIDTPADPTYPENTPMPTAAPGDVIGGLDTISGQLENIDNTLTGVQEGVGEAVGQLEGINEGIGSISEALEVPTSSEAPNFKFDLTTLFPFCIPFDIYRFVTMFSASPVAPHVQIPFNIPAINLNYTFDLDFSSFDSVASVLRSVELIAFCVGLAILTSKVIRW